MEDTETKKTNDKTNYINKNLLNNPLFLPKGTIRDIIALIFAIGFILIINNLLNIFSKSDASQFNSIFTTFVGVVNLVIGYYFGNRNSQ